VEVDVAPTVGKGNRHLEEAALPHRLLFTRDSALPDLQIENAEIVLLRARVEAERVVFTPLLPAKRMSDLWLPAIEEALPGDLAPRSRKRGGGLTVLLAGGSGTAPW